MLILNPSVFEAYIVSVKLYTILRLIFFYQDLIHCPDADDTGAFADMLFKSIETGESFGISPTDISRDGMFDSEALYAVYEKEDIQKIISLLTGSL